jgi:hAT family C-terminal dimerisation region
MKKSKTILQYWQVDGMRWPSLQKLALKVYSMVVSLASAERNFSIFGFVHSKLRNQHDPETGLYQNQHFSV